VVQPVPGQSVVRPGWRGAVTVKPGEARRVITVTAGIMERDGKILVARRKPGKHMGGKWEFPGGKMEAGETPQQTLARELEEELAVRAEVGGFLCSAAWEGDGLSLELLVYRVLSLEGEPVLREHQEIRWVEPGALGALDLADSDRKVAEELFGTP
jgi:8-oxo-dGTP diphosphatase